MSDQPDKTDRSLTNFLLYPKFQRPALLLVILTATLSLFSCGVMIYLETKLLLKNAEIAGNYPAVTSTLWQYGLISGSIFLFSTFLMCAWALVFTHRMIGPINRIKSELHRMHETESIHLITLREDDFLRPLIQKYNQVLWGLSLDSNWEEPSQVPGDLNERELTKDGAEGVPDKK